MYSKLKATQNKILILKLQQVAMQATDSVRKNVTDRWFVRL